DPKNSPILLPAHFKDNRITVHPTTDDVTLNFFTDTGGSLIMTPKGVSKAQLEVYKDMIDKNEFHTVNLPVLSKNKWIPSIIEKHWIPPIVTKEPTGQLYVVDGGQLLAGMDGMLGQAWFANRIWTFDYLNKQLIYHQALDMKMYDDQHAVQLWFYEDEAGKRKFHFPRVKATIDGETLDFLFDTGATLRLTEAGLNELNDDGSQVRGTCFITENMFNH